jgi:hypothetical protein
MWLNRKFAAQGLSLFLLLLIASACSAIMPDNPVATLQTERQRYIDEATSIAQAAQVQGTQVGATAAAAQTHVAQMEGRNQQLVATLRAALPPTQAIVNDSGPVTPGSLATPLPPGAGQPAATQADSGQATALTASLGDMQFTQVGTASSVRSSDDCAENLTTTFPTNARVVYITTRVLNAKAGTVMRVAWSYQDQVTSSDQWTVPRDDNDFCLWLSLEPQGDVFASGNWSVQLYANNVPIDPKVNFTIGG